MHRVADLPEGAGPRGDVQQREQGDAAFILAVEGDLVAVRRPVIAFADAHLVAAHALAVADARSFGFRDDGFLFSLERPEERGGKFGLQRLHLFQTCVHGGPGDLLHEGSGRIGPRRIREDVDIGETHGLQEAHGLLKQRFDLAGMAHDDVRTQMDGGHQFPGKPGVGGILRREAAAVHDLQNVIGPVLQGHVEKLTEPALRRGHYLQDIRKHLAGLRRTQTDPPGTRLLQEGLQKFRESGFPAAVAAEIASGKDDLAESGLHQRAEVGQDLRQFPGPLGPADTGDHAVGTVISASVLNLERRPCLEGGEGQGGFPVHALGESVRLLLRGGGRFQIGQIAGQQRFQFGLAFAGEQEVDLRTVLQLLPLQRGGAAREDQEGLRIFRADAPQGLHGFFQGRGGDGAGVDDDDIGAGIGVLGGNEFESHIAEARLDQCGIRLIQPASESQDSGSLAGHDVANL